MNYQYHDRVPREIREAERYYIQEAAEEIADAFFDELLSLIDKAAENPHHFHFADKNRRYRRANLKRFPYHFIFKEFSSFIYIIAVRHNERHPNYGMRRQVKPRFPSNRRTSSDE